MPRPFGHITEREQRKAEVIRQHQTLYRAERKRQDVRFELEQIFKRQNARIAATLKQSTDRILAARWGSPEGDSMVAVTRRGSTEVSRPIRREYKEQ